MYNKGGQAMEIFSIEMEDKKMKIGDIINVSMRMDFEVPEEDLERNNYITPDLDVYDRQYEVSYSYPRSSGFTNVNYTDSAGCCSSYCDINEYLKDRIKEDLPFLLDYEIFDVDDTDGECQTAKIRIKAFKEEEEKEGSNYDGHLPC